MSKPKVIWNLEPDLKAHLQKYFLLWFIFAIVLVLAFLSIGGLFVMGLAMLAGGSLGFLGSTGVFSALWIVYRFAQNLFNMANSD